MKNHLTLMGLLLLAAGFAFAGGPALPPNASSISGLGTMATVNSPVPVANGGTGAATAENARTALGAPASSATVLTSGANAMTGDLKFSGNYGILQATADGADSGLTYLVGGGAIDNTRGGALVAYGNEYPTTGGMVYYRAGNVATGDHRFVTGAAVERFTILYGGNVGVANTNPSKLFCISSRFAFDSSGIFYWGTAADHGRLSWDTGKAIVTTSSDTYALVLRQPGGERLVVAPATGNILIKGATDDGTNALQVNGPVYVASYVSALGYIDRTEAPDTVADAYAIVESHEVDASGNLDHSKLSPLAYGRKVELRPTGKMLKQAVTEPVTMDGKEITIEKTVVVPETEQVVVPDPAGRDLSMVISAQAFVIKDLVKRIEALEAKIP